MDRELRSQLDSLQVELREGEIEVRARLRTDRLPRDMMGPFSGMLGASERVLAAGPVRVTRPGAGEWRVRSFRIGELTVPDEMVPALVGRALGHPDRTAVPVAVPEGIRSIRVRRGQRGSVRGHPVMSHRVLIVDDEQGIRQALKQVLEYEDLDVRVAASGGEAITALLRVPAAPRLPRREDGGPRRAGDAHPAPRPRSRARRSS